MALSILRVAWPAIELVALWPIGRLPCMNVMLRRHDELAIATRLPYRRRRLPRALEVPSLGVLDVAANMISDLLVGLRALSVPHLDLAIRFDVRICQHWPALCESCQIRLDIR